mgnify:CR=1 FL=1|tara:strand:- start:248 stop:892 length:645 start_codon:yes stop_codon:yes gene_type:complete
MANKTELEAFKVAMALTEGGGKIDYTQVNSLTGATGAYQFLPKYWDWYSSNAGYAGADINDPTVQNAVALYWFDRNYNDFGSWELAAIAHFAGRKIAGIAKENGVESVYSLKDGTGVDIKTYVDKVLSYMAKEMPKAGKKVLQTMEQNTPIYQNPLTDKEVVTKEAANVLDVMTNAMSENSRSQFPMQVPSGIQDYDSAIYKTRMNRLKKGIGK